MTDTTDKRTNTTMEQLDEHRGLLRVEDVVDTDIHDLWSALTEPTRLSRWYGDVDGELRPGGRFTTRIEPADIDGTGRVEHCEPPHRLVVTTRETDASAARGQGPAPFDEVVEATLHAEGDRRTRMVLEIRGLPLDRLPAYATGWQVNTEALAAYVTGAPPVDVPTRWQELLPVYASLTPEPPAAG